jgi:hypothetical protein
MSNVYPLISANGNDEDAVDAALEDAKQAHGVGNVVAVSTVRGWAIFRAPTAAEAMRYKSLLNDDKSKPQASGVLARVVVVWPARETFDEWATAKPLIADEVIGPILELAGLTGKAATKK